MTQYKISPKYLLLTAPTLKASRSLHGHSISAKIIQSDYRKQLEKTSEGDGGKKVLQKSAVFTKQIDSVREQLASCMQNTLNQAKRNNVLKQLNSILQNSNLLIEEQSKNQWKERVQNEKRKCQKEQAQIQQILQKYNEEVAKINTLREMANSARTDRVVYSALFKKIQWEIKHYQNLYRETIIKTETNKISKSQKQPCTTQILQSTDEYQTREQFAKCCFKYNEPMKNPLFMTELQKNSEARGSKKVNSRRSHQAQLKLIQQIDQIQAKIEQIVKTVECTNAEDTLEWYSSLESQNVELLKLIDQEQSKIQEIQNEMMRIWQARRNSEVIEERHMRKLQTLSSTRKLRTLRHIKLTESEEQSITEYVVRLAKIAGIRLTKNRPLTDAVIQLQQRLTRQQLVNGELRSGCNLQSGVDIILNKMERFDSCERIFSKRQFEGEYTRELTKQKKNQRARK